MERAAVAIKIKKSTVIRKGGERKLLLAVAAKTTKR